MPQSDFVFANDIRAAASLRTPHTSRMLLRTSLALLVAFLVWAHFAILEEVKRGNGRVVPSQQTQVVQSLEGGIVSELLSGKSPEGRSAAREAYKKVGGPKLATE